MQSTSFKVLIKVYSSSDRWVIESNKAIRFLRTPCYCEKAPGGRTKGNEAKRESECECWGGWEINKRSDSRI